MTAARRARLRTALPGSQFPLGATVRDGGTNFAVASGVADGMMLCLFDEAGTETQVPLLDYDAGVWHGFVPGVGPGRPTDTGPRGPTTRPAGLRCNPAKLLLDPYARAHQRDRHVRARGARLRGWRRPGRAEHARLGGARAAQPGRGRARSRWSDGDRPRRSLRRHDHLRGARQGLHHAPPGGPAGAARHLRRARPRGGHRPPDRPRRDRRRTAAGPRERARGVPAAARADQLLGLQHDRLLRAAPGLLRRGAGRAARRPGRPSSRPWSTPCTRPGSRCCSTWSSTTPPRATSSGPTLCYRGLDNPAYYRLEPGDPRRYVDTTGCGNSLNAGRPRDPAADHGLAAVLGDGYAR